jgi:hypothetical protein
MPQPMIDEFVLREKKKQCKNVFQNFEGNESFMHKAAKELLYEWLTERWAGYEQPINNEIMFIEEKTGEQWKSTIGYNPQLIQLEYPITSCFPYYLDENHNTDCGCTNYTFGLDNEGIEYCNYRENMKNCQCLSCKWFDKKDLLGIADLAIGYKGQIVTIIEIFHKSPVSPKKFEVYNKSTRINVYPRIIEIDAKHIMGQITKPKRLFVRKLC